MPLASVKKRSNRPVMSVSICSGGMPEKKVATTTTGNVDRREQVHRHAHQAGHPHHAHDEADDDDQIGIANGKARHGYGMN